jgi:RNA polymerase subunit RPABC4/transcription elongation factor Spt4
MLIKCSECGNQVSDKASSCPSCGNPISITGISTKYCSECGKQVPDKVNSCPSCGNPISKDDIAVNNNINADSNIAFESRINEYKANGYKLLNRSGDKAVLHKYDKGWSYLTMFSAPIGAILMVITFIIANDEFSRFYLIYLGMIVLPVILLFYNTKKVNIFLTKTGEIEETGHTLKV